MSAPLISKLDELKNSNNLISTLENSKTLTDLLPVLGYSKNTGKYISVIKRYLEENNIDYLLLLGRNNLEEKTCPVCFKKWFVNKTNSKAMAQVTCSRACCNTHLRSGENNPNWKDGLKSYRLKALKKYGEICQLCGFNNPLAIVVHHIDEDRNNNDIENLIVLCANCHMIAHEGNFHLEH